jgi:hypothetical protein
MADKIIDHIYRLKIDFFSLFVALERSVNCSTVSTKCHFFCHLVDSGWARINWIRAVDKFCVEQLISCQKCRPIDCRPIDCRAIKFWAVHPHSPNFNIFHFWRIELTFLPRKNFFIPFCHLISVAVSFYQRNFLEDSQRNKFFEFCVLHWTKRLSIISFFK